MLVQRAKQWLLGHRVGDWLMGGRDRLALLHAAWRTPERVGTLANDQLAGWLVARLPRPGHTFIDVGAHIGSVLAAVDGRHAGIRLVAVEAMPDKAARLRRKFPHACVHACAVGEAAGEVAFYVNTRHSGYSSLSGGGAGSAGGTVHTLRVPLHRLDELEPPGNGQPPVDVVKIDVEGAELGVLRGATGLLAGSRPVVMFESGPDDAPGLGYTKPALWEFFTQQGYVLLLPHRLAHDGPALGLDGFLDSHAYPRRSTNYFAVPAERRTAVRDQARTLLGIVPRPAQA